MPQHWGEIAWRKKSLSPMSITLVCMIAQPTIPARLKKSWMWLKMWVVKIAWFWCIPVIVTDGLFNSVPLTMGRWLWDQRFIFPSTVSTPGWIWNPRMIRLAHGQAGMQSVRKPWLTLSMSMPRHNRGENWNGG